MSHEAMKVEQSQPSRAQLLQNLTTGPLASSISKLSGSSRAIPSKEDFYYYHNFDEFKEDMDDAYDWLVNVNDEVLERFDASVDEFKRIRKEDEETKRPVKVVTKDKKTVGTKPKVSFHVPSIRKPQEQFNILVNNSNQPFEHVWLPRSEDAHRFLHPLEKLSILDFIDNGIGDVEPIKPPEIEATPFKLVEEVKDLKELAAKLRSVNEFAVDLEHNQYRSFQGLTCLMQISTRTEDFIVDTLKLRIHVGPYLRELFKDPFKRKVMHGADRDIVWLQRDFGIYVCNLFDTGQASRVLKLERNSWNIFYITFVMFPLTKNTRMQTGDSALLPKRWSGSSLDLHRFLKKFLYLDRYAREDTHYLLHIYDLMRTKLSSMPKESESSDTPLIEVYKRSYDICMHLYEKELFTENPISTYMGELRLQGACFNSQQLAVVSGLCEWRDVVARTEDESTGYILPNKSLLELAKQMPDTTNKLRRLVKSKHPYIEQHLDSVVSVIRHSLQNAAFFEAAAEHLKVGRVESSSEENILVTDRSESFLPDESGCNSVNGDVSAPSPTTLTA
ncbi:hypothetical protein M0R45_007129 [Rubus argutus]|uniref:HRDC domain-containing protein n=1 Tax=Rubus argutus TaxID=59490 RepID=A0AAW1YSV5_RUBAR